MGLAFVYFVVMSPSGFHVMVESRVCFRGLKIYHGDTLRSRVCDAIPVANIDRLLEPTGPASIRGA